MNKKEKDKIIMRDDRSYYYVRVLIILGIFLLYGQI